jgi:hypothetical protein
MNMKNEPESVTDVRVRLYRKALAQLREENELAEREAERTKEAEEQSAKEPKTETAEGPEEPIEPDPKAQKGATRAEFLGRS